MAKTPHDPLIAELRGLRADLADSTERIVQELGQRIEANGQRIEANGERIEANTARLDSIDGRLMVVEQSMGWFRQQTLTLSRQVADAVSGRSRFEAQMDEVRSRLDAL